MTILPMYVWHMWPPNLDISNKNISSSNQSLSTKKAGDGDDQLMINSQAVKRADKPISR